MNIEIDNLFKYSFVLTTSNDNLNRFYDIFNKCGLNYKPEPYFGRFVLRDSREYLYNQHCVAAHMSHFKICNIAKERKYPYVCIFEEDSIPCNNIIEKLQYFLKDIPDDSYLYRLGYVPFAKKYDYNNDTIECVINKQVYFDNYFGGSHAYIIFNSFYKYNDDMIELYKNNIEPYLSCRSVHNWKHYSKEQLKYIWFYEWMFNPNIYKNELLKKVYSVNVNENLFTQYKYVTWNDYTLSKFK